MASITYDKSKKFAVRIIKLYKWLTEEKKEFVLSKQLLRSGTSIGANLAEAQGSISKADFIMKVHISLKECKETIYWIELLYQTEFLNANQFDSLTEDVTELEKLLTSTLKTSKGQD